MSEDKHENNGRTTSNKVNKDALMNLLNNLAKSDYTIDMNTMKRTASNLVNDDSPVNTGHDHGDFQQNPTQTPTFQQEYQRKSDFTLLSEQLENLANGISALRDELAGLKDKNKKLIEQISGLGKSNKRKNNHLYIVSITIEKALRNHPRSFSFVHNGITKKKVTGATF